MVSLAFFLTTTAVYKSRWGRCRPLDSQTCVGGTDSYMETQLGVDSVVTVKKGRRRRKGKGCGEKNTQ